MQRLVTAATVIGLLVGPSVAEESAINNQQMAAMVEWAVANCSHDGLPGTAVAMDRGLRWD